jgi:hypothetical protein
MKNCVPAIASLLLLISFSALSQTTFPPTTPDQYLTALFDRSIVFDTTGIHRVTVVEDSLAAWKEWRTVDNFYYGKNRGSLMMIADLRALHPYFRDKVEALITGCKALGITLAVVETYRTHAKQAEYFAMGKKYTSTPGGKSRHQFGLAVDVVPMVDSMAVWNNNKLWRKIGVVGERLGLRWGGRWRVVYDPGHFEWSGGLSRYQLVKGILPRIPPAVIENYPSILTDLARLQNLWQAWEAEQSVVARKETNSDNEGVAGIGQ